MARTVTLDKLTLGGANIWVDENTGAIRLEMNYVVSASAGGQAFSRQRDVQVYLTPAEKGQIVALTSRLKGVLEAEELA
ncbi:MAG: hypothetical protein HY685_03685 [Chloroflexi bacterium]|nr:hypothetical protein [Chloroflexota bacterium]